MEVTTPRIIEKNSRNSASSPQIKTIEDNGDEKYQKEYSILRARLLPRLLSFEQKWKKITVSSENLGLYK